MYQYAQRLAKLKGQERRVFDTVMNNRKIIDLIVYLNTEEQLRKEGVDSTGKIIGTYSLATEFITDGRKKAGEPFDLYDTGAFYNSFRVKIKNGKIRIKADPMKTNDQGKSENIYEKFGNFKIEGLTEENIEVVRKFCVEYFKKWFIKNVVK